MNHPFTPNAILQFQSIELYVCMYMKYFKNFKTNDVH